MQILKRDHWKGSGQRKRVRRTNAGVSYIYIHICIYMTCIQVAYQLFHIVCISHVYAIVPIILGSILMLNDLQSVYKKVIKAAKNWFNLGLALGLDHDTLDNIKDEYHRNNKDCLREMIVVRLKTGPLTYSEICQSLRAPTVDRNDVATAIEEACTGIL